MPGDLGAEGSGGCLGGRLAERGGRGAADGGVAWLHRSAKRRHIRLERSCHLGSRLLNGCTPPPPQSKAGGASRLEPAGDARLRRALATRSAHRQR
eukprot:5893034-Prymnesium_polylepis.1